MNKYIYSTNGCTTRMHACTNIYTPYDLNDIILSYVRTHRMEWNIPGDGKVQRSWRVED